MHLLHLSLAGVGIDLRTISSLCVCVPSCRSYRSYQHFSLNLTPAWTSVCVQREVAASPRIASSGFRVVDCLEELHFENKTHSNVTADSLEIQDGRN